MVCSVKNFPQMSQITQILTSFYLCLFVKSVGTEE